ncbi:MAG: hypothetical protein JWL73_18 [Actinomycetia bacterium]|nr:hypothetical protein [Actinomycetes bacterium]
MTDAGYVFAGWGITALVLGGYALRVVLRTRHAQQVAERMEETSA